MMQSLLDTIWCEICLLAQSKHIQLVWIGHVEGLVSGRIMGHQPQHERQAAFVTTIACMKGNNDNNNNMWLKEEHFLFSVDLWPTWQAMKYKKIVSGGN